MHKDLYNINVAFCCSENLVKSLEEVKPFLGFNLNTLNIVDRKNSLNNNYDVLVIESESSKRLSLDDVTIPKVLVKKQKEKNNLETNFNLVIRLPINIIEFNRSIVDLSQKHKFDQNSLIKIKNYILDKNERVLKQNDKRLKVTEKEIYFIENLLASKKPLSKNFILENIWKYSSETDTHTVETHIYRLRQKIKNHFNDDNFIKYTGEGYSL